METKSQPPEKPKKLLSSPKVKTLFFLAGLLGIAILGAFLLLLNVKDMCDDAMISARFARNLGLGYGLRYNLDPQTPPVEGFSNFLWTLALAVGFKLQLHPRLTSAGLGILSSFLSILALGFWIRKQTGQVSLSLLGALLLATSLPFLLWSVQGLETPLFALLTLLALAFHHPEQPRPLPYLFSTLAALTRPDGLLLPVALFLSHLLILRKNLLPLLKTALPSFLLPYSLYTLWRVFYFHSLFPNVFYAKTGLGFAGAKVGVEYVLTAALETWPISIIFLLALVFLLLRLLQSPASSEAKFSWKIFLAPFLTLIMYLIFMVSVAGDFMPHHRFFMHIFPIVIGMSLIGVGNWVENRGGRRTILVLAAVSGLGWNGYQIWDYETHPSFSRNWHQDQAKWYGRSAAWLVRNAKPDDLIAVGDIGYIGFVTQTNPILDTNGLIEPHLAHRPGPAGFSSDVDYVFSKQPKFIVIIVHYFDEKSLGHSAFDREALASERLKNEYELVAELPGWTSQEKSFADGLTRTSLVRFRIYQKR